MKIFDLTPELELQIQDRLLPPTTAKPSTTVLTPSPPSRSWKSSKGDGAGSASRLRLREGTPGARFGDDVARPPHRPRRKMKKIQEYEEKIQRVAWALDELRKAVEYPARLNPQSPAQLQDFFYGHLCIPEIQLGFKGQRRLPQIEKLLKNAVLRWAIPFVNHILKLRDLKVILAMLRTGVDQDSRLGHLTEWRHRNWSMVFPPKRLWYRWKSPKPAPNRKGDHRCRPWLQVRLCRPGASGVSRCWLDLLAAFRRTCLPRRL
jgi:hypothetical protein